MSNFDIKHSSTPADLVAAEGRYLLSDAIRNEASESKTKSRASLLARRAGAVILSSVAVVAGANFIGDRINQHEAAVSHQNAPVAAHIISQEHANMQQAAETQGPVHEEPPTTPQ